MPALVISEPTRLVVVAAHPDDESLGAGGLMARADLLGIPVHVIVATNGDASHPRSQTTSPTQLASIRRTELRAAVRSVAPGASVEFLDLPDGRLGAHHRELTARVAAATAGDGALIVAPWRHDGHEDHEAAGAAASEVARETGAQLLEYPVWMWHWATPTNEQVPWEQFVSLQLSAEELSAKATAILAHTSQNLPLSAGEGDEQALCVGFREYFDRPFEVYVTPAGPCPPPGDRFDDFYQGGDDPWGFETRWYEIRKRSLTVASLPRPLFAKGLEIGCSTGVLTVELAGRCAELVATDTAERSLRRARARLAGQSHVSFVRGTTPTEWPEGSFDLVVLSEIAYYWSREELQLALRLIDASLTEDGVLVACHWRHEVDDHLQGADDVHAALRAYPGFSVLAEHREDDFLLDVFVRPTAQSVAREAGLL